MWGLSGVIENVEACMLFPAVPTLGGGAVELWGSLRSLPSPMAAVRALWGGCGSAFSLSVLVVLRSVSSSEL
eukprot:930739-Rhodomonas_salina.2